jgi:hypothetical protein
LIVETGVLCYFFEKAAEIVRTLFDGFGLHPFVAAFGNFARSEIVRPSCLLFERSSREFLGQTSEQQQKRKGRALCRHRYEEQKIRSPPLLFSPFFRSP